MLPLLLALGVGVGVGVTVGHADAGDTRDALLAVHGGDPMDYAAVVRRLGDDALLEVLALPEDETSAALRLAAVRAAPYARAPEVVLPAVVELAHLRDPAVAPAAVRAALQIAYALEFADMEAREYDPAELTPAIVRLRELNTEEAGRADLRLLAGHAAERLASMQGVQHAPDEAADSQE